jgi:hypothetical protein
MLAARVLAGWVSLMNGVGPNSGPNTHQRRSQSGHRACAVPMSAFGGKADIASQLMTQKAEVIF